MVPSAAGEEQPTRATGSPRAMSPPATSSVLRLLAALGFLSCSVDLLIPQCDLQRKVVPENRRRRLIRRELVERLAELHVVHLVRVLELHLASQPGFGCPGR